MQGVRNWQYGIACWRYSAVGKQYSTAGRRYGAVGAQNLAQTLACALLMRLVLAPRGCGMLRCAVHVKQALGQTLARGLRLVLAMRGCCMLRRCAHGGQGRGARAAGRLAEGLLICDRGSGLKAFRVLGCVRVYGV